MRLSVLVASCVAVFSANAHKAVAQSWTGPYAGIHAGYRWADLDLTTPSYQFVDVSNGATFQVPARDESFSIEGALAGLHGGYNLMITPSVVIGVEADISFTGGNSARTAQFTSTLSGGCEIECEAQAVNASRLTRIDLDWQATVRARFGYTSGSTLFYATAGVAFMNVDWTEVISVPGGQTSVSSEETLTGVAVGGGVENFLTPNLLGRIEYLYEDFESLSVPLALTSEPGDLDLTAHKLRIGLSYKF